MFGIIKKVANCKMLEVVILLMTHLIHYVFQIKLNIFMI